MKLPENFDPNARVVDMAEWRAVRMIGELVLARAEHDPEFRALFLRSLDEFLTDPEDRALFGFASQPLA